MMRTRSKNAVQGHILLLILLGGTVLIPVSISIKAKPLAEFENSFGWANERMPPGLRRSEQPNEYIWEKDGSVMVYVPPGTFEMGRDWIRDEEKPIHTVRLDGFYIDKLEVTRSAFGKFIASSGHKTTAEKLGTGIVVRPESFLEERGRSWREPGFPQGDDHPVVLVSWEDARAYASWLGKNLPTEAQWEKAATWDENSPAGKKKRIYPWGDSEATGLGAGRANLIKLGNFQDVSFAELMPKGTQRDYLLNPHFGGQYNDEYVYTAPVGTFPLGKSPCGALDLSGNVWEWCEDGYAKDFYRRSPTENPVNNDAHVGRVIRGSGYDTPCTGPNPSAFRAYVPAVTRYSTIGFRCAVRGL